MNKEFLCGGRSYGKTFFQNRIKQAYENGKQDGFREKENLIKYLEDKIKEYKDMCIGRLYSSRTRIECGVQIKACQGILERIKSGKYDDR